MTVRALRPMNARGLRRAGAVLAAVALAAGLVSCGSDDSPDGSATDTVAAAPGSTLAGPSDGADAPASETDQADAGSSETAGASAGGSAPADSSGADPASSEGIPTSPESAAAPSVSDEDYYPHTMETLHGPVTIEAKPEKILVLGVVTAEELLSLGVTPDAVAVDPADLEPQYPWIADDIADIAHADLYANGSYGDLQMEAIAALDPDLVIGRNLALQDKTVFDRLNEIAPTVVPDTTSMNPDWDDRLRYTAEAVNASDAAEQLITDIVGEYATVADGVPGIEGKTYNFVVVNDGAQFGFGNGAIFELFGLQPNDSQDNTLSGDGLSFERTAELSADLLVVWPVRGDDSKAVFDDNRLTRDLPAVQNDTVIYADLPVAGSLNEPGPVSLRWLLEKVTPTIEKLAG